MPLKIAHLTDTISNNGVSRVLLSLTSSMQDRGVETKILVFKPIENKELANQFGCGIERLSIPEIEPRRFFWKSKWAVLGYAEGDSALLDSWAKDNSIDFVFIHGRSILRFYKAKTPHAVVAHNTKSKMLLPRLGSPRRALVRSTVNKIYSSQPVASVSEGIRQDFIEEFGVDSKSIQTIYNPIDIDTIRNKANEAVIDIPPRPYFIAAGAAKKVKRFDVLIRAFAQCEVDADLVILGHGGMLDDYRKLAAKLGVSDRLHLPGYKINPYVYFKHAIALAVSSEYEGLPTGIIEALACGIPVVSTDCPSGPREVLTGKYSEFLVPVGDVSALASVMDKVARNPYSYPDKLFEKFNPSLVAEYYEQFAKKHMQ